MEMLEQNVRIVTNALDDDLEFDLTTFLETVEQAVIRDGVKIETDQQRAAYTLALQQFDTMIEWNKDGVDAALRKTAAALEIKLKDMIRAFYLAVLGTPQGVPLFDAITHLGRDILRERLRHAMELLGPASKKETEAWSALLAKAETSAG
jgi:glutamyl-tRNA synthetase